jgi:GT2 family glycosyltransferase
VDCAVAVALLVDRDALLAAGGYDETMFILFEDLDLSYRLRAGGARIVSVEDCLVLHKGGTPGISFREGPRYPGSRVFFHSRNRWTFVAKCFRTRTILVALPGLALYELAWFAFALAQGHAGDWWRGKRAFFALRGRRRAERARFQAARTLSDRELLVGGPLTITPALKSSRPRALLDGALGGALRAWWWIARPFAG